MNNYLAKKQKGNCCVCDFSREEFIKSFPDKIEFVSNGLWTGYNIIDGPAFHDFLVSREVDGVRFVSDDPWHSNFYCLGCLKTLILNESQTQLVRKS